MADRPSPPPVSQSAPTTCQTSPSEAYRSSKAWFLVNVAHSRLVRPRPARHHPHLVKVPRQQLRDAAMVQSRRIEAASEEGNATRHDPNCRFHLPKFKGECAKLLVGLTGESVTAMKSFLRAICGNLCSSVPEPETHRWAQISLSTVNLPKS